MSNTIRRLTLSCILFSFLSINLIAQTAEGKEAFVMKIENLSQDQNVAIFGHFSRNQEVKVINSCQELGLIVFQVQGHNELGALGASHSVSTILKNQFEIDNAQILTGYSQNDVNVDCRAKVKEIIGQ